MQATFLCNYVLLWIQIKCANFAFSSLSRIKMDWIIDIIKGQGPNNYWYWVCALSYIDTKGTGVIPKLRAGTLTLGSHGGWGGGGAIVGLTWIYIPHCPTARHLHYPMLLYMLYILYILYLYHPVYIILIDGVLYSSYTFSWWPLINHSIQIPKYAIPAAISGLKGCVLEIRDPYYNL